MQNVKRLTPRFLVLAFGLVAISVVARADDARVEFSDCDMCPVLVKIEPGSFSMGSADDEVGREDDEGPVHKVTIANAFALGKTEITRAAFAAFVDASDYQPENGCWYIDTVALKWQSDPARSWKNPGFPQKDDHPVTCISWGGRSDVYGLAFSKNRSELQVAQRSRVGICRARRYNGEPILG